MPGNRRPTGELPYRPAVGVSAERNPAGTLVRVLAGMALVLLALSPPLNYASDGSSMLAVTEGLLDHGSFAISCGDPGAVHGAGGACFSNFYLLESLLLVPFVALGRGLGTLLGAPTRYTGAAAALALPALCTAGAATLTVAMARERGAGRRGAVLAGAAFALGTEALTYARTLFAESLGALAVALAAWGSSGASPRRRALGAVGSGAAFATPARGLVRGVDPNDRDELLPE